MVGFGDNAGSGFPTILKTWKDNGWVRPQLLENTILNQVSLLLSYEKREEKNSGKKSAIIVGGESSYKVRRNSEKFWQKVLNDVPKGILMLIKEDKTNSVLSMASKLNITLRTVEKNIKILREQGIIVRPGAARGGYWEIKE